MLSRLILLVTWIGLAVQAASVPDVQEPKYDRDGKLLPVIQIVTFDNGPCATASGGVGTCYSQNECSALGGTQDGTCANGFGVCCTVTATCGGTISVNNTHFINPSYPTGYNTAGQCTASLSPPAGTCQVLLHFEAFDILGPEAGDCSNDTFSFTGSSNDMAIPTLCGYNAGQHMYIDVMGTSGPWALTFNLASFSYLRNWKIRVSYIEQGNPCKAPDYCLQYHKETSGTIQSFNFGMTNPIMLNNLRYAICFAPITGYCDAGVTFTRFDFGNINNVCTNDFVAAGGFTTCGDFNAFSLSANCTAGPLILNVVSDSNNDNLEEGFSGTYMRIAN